MYLGSTCCLKGMVGKLVLLHQQLVEEGGVAGGGGVCWGGEAGEEHFEGVGAVSVPPTTLFSQI